MKKHSLTFQEVKKLDEQHLWHNAIRASWQKQNFMHSMMFLWLV